jgi:predicted DNA-binding ribbon-helix-helix protein
MSRRKVSIRSSPSTTPRTVTVSVRLAEDSHGRLRVAAARRGVSMGALLAELWEQSRQAKAEGPKR